MGVITFELSGRHCQDDKPGPGGLSLALRLNKGFAAIRAVFSVGPTLRLGILGLSDTRVHSLVKHKYCHLFHDPLLRNQG